MKGVAMFGCFFGHDWGGWAGCTCTRCGKTRDERHDWDGCRCMRCGTLRDEEHDWNGCVCRHCGKHRDEQHDWNGCKCKRCGETRHEWKEGRCGNCSESYHTLSCRDGGGRHSWVQESYSFHDPDPSACGDWIAMYRCSVCGAVHEESYGNPLP